jgi:hypothetical protein
VRVNATVTSASKPFGTFPTVIPTAKMKLVIGGYPRMNPQTKNMTPLPTANIANRFIKRSISFANGEIY